MGESMTPKEEKFIRELFEVFDKDADGKISVKELKKGFRANGTNPTKLEMKQIMAEMGISKGEKISRQQFDKCMIRYVRDDKIGKVDKAKAEKDLITSFKVFDKDNSGYIDRKELTRVLTSLGEKLSDHDVNDMFIAADKNSDGKIQYKEFVALFTQNMG